MEPDIPVNVDDGLRLMELEVVAVVASYKQDPLFTVALLLKLFALTSVHPEVCACAIEKIKTETNKLKNIFIIKNIHRSLMDFIKKFFTKKVYFYKLLNTSII
jgi:hypothetical protein